MNEEAKERLRTAVLMQLAAARPVGLRVEPIRIGVKLAGFQRLENNELEKQLRYLEAHGMISREERPMNKAVDIYQITQSGVALLDENFLLPD